MWFPIRRGVFRADGGPFKAVDGIDVSVREGQTLGVVGESGSGKTTLGLALLRLISSRAASLCSDRIAEACARRGPLRRDMQIVFQDPFGSLSPRLSVSEIVGEGLQVHQPD